jgi:hypothetical protein
LHKQHKQESEELDAGTASLGKKHLDLPLYKAKKDKKTDKKTRAASAPAAASKGKGKAKATKAKATARASDVQPRDKKPRFAPITYKDDDWVDGSDYDYWYCVDGSDSDS